MPIGYYRIPDDARDGERLSGKAADSGFLLSNYQVM